MVTPRLSLPEAPRALVVVVSTPADQTHERVIPLVAASLWSAGFATLEADLVTPGENAAGVGAASADWLLGVLEAARRIPALRGLDAGVFVAGPDAAAVLAAVAGRPDLVDSIVAELPGGTLACVDKGFLTVLGKHADAHRGAQDALCREAELTTKWFRDTLCPDRVH